MAIASGIAKNLVFKKETTWGTAAGASGAQTLRRVTSDLALGKEVYESEEIVSHYQVVDSRDGVRSIAGKISGELSPGTYSLPIAAAVRKAWTTVADLTGLTLTFIAGASAITISRSAGSFLTAGLKKGDVIAVTAGAVNAANLNKSVMIVSETALSIAGIVLNGVSMVSEGPIASCTISLRGKKTWAPSTGHTDDSFSIEHWHSDIAQSELFVGCKFTELAFSLPPTGMAKFDATVMGRDMVAGTSAYFTSPTAPTSSGVLAAVNGALTVGGTQVALLTGLNFSVAGGHSAEPVVGSNLYPFIFAGRVRVKGQATVFFQDAYFRDIFDQESETDLNAVFTTGNAGMADFMAVSMPRIKLRGAGKNDGEKGLVQTIPFEALYNTAGGTGINEELTTISFQDSLA